MYEFRRKVGHSEMSSVLRRGPEFGPAPKPPVFSLHTAS